MVEILLGFDDSANLADFLESLAPKKKEYIGLQDYLANIRRLASSSLPEIGEGPLLKRGVSHETVSQLRQHLIRVPPTWWMRTSSMMPSLTQ